MRYGKAEDNLGHREALPLLTLPDGQYYMPPAGTAMKTGGGGGENLLASLTILYIPSGLINNLAYRPRERSRQ
jgi:hypothetical protein